MRLLTSKLYRAFPELDAFSDDQCRAFMWAANRSWRLLVVRWCIVLVVAALALVAAGATLTGIIQLSKRMHLWVGLEALAVLVIVGGMLLGGFGLALRTRDWLLLQRVRRVIAERGHCHQCGYSLLGMRVGTDLRVVCPECGKVTTADDSLNELATDDSGGRVFQPSAPREDPEVRARRRRRRRAAFKWSAITVGSLVLVFGVLAGAWWWSLVAQSRRAAAARNFGASVAELVAKHHRPEALGRPNDYPQLIAILTEVQTHAQGFPARFAAENPDAEIPTVSAVDFSSMGDVGSPSQYRRSMGTPLSLARAMASEAIVQARANGLLDRAAAISGMSRFERGMSPPAGESSAAIMIPELGMARSFARFCTARMTVAVRAGDRAEYLAALDQMLTVANAVDHQGFLIDHLVAVAIRALAFSRVREHLNHDPNAALWAGETLSVIRARQLDSLFELVVEMERQSTLDSLRWIFSDPGRAARATALGDLGALGAMLSSSPQRVSVSISSYDDHARDANAYFDAALEVFKDGPLRAAPLTTKPSRPINQFLAASFDRAVASEVRLAKDAQLTVILLALEQYRTTHGRYPERLELLASSLPEGWTNDFVTGEPFEYRLVDDPSRPGGKRPEFGLALDVNTPAGDTKPKTPPK